MGVHPGALVVVCDLVDSRPSLMDRVLAFDLVNFFFPPKPLALSQAEITETFAYHYRQHRDLNHDTTPMKYSYAATTSITCYGWTREGKPILHKEGKAKPVYRRGTRNSRMAQVAQ